MIQPWCAEPVVDEIVWCHFPDDIHPRPKPLPALVLVVFDDDAPQFTVRVAYGTSQRTTRLHRGELSILHERNPAAYAAAGLSYDTKFDLKQVLDPAVQHRMVLGATRGAPWPDAQAGRAASVLGARRAGGVSGRC